MFVCRLVLFIVGSVHRFSVLANMDRRNLKGVLSHGAHFGRPGSSAPQLFGRAKASSRSTIPAVRNNSDVVAQRVALGSGESRVDRVAKQVEAPSPKALEQPSSQQGSHPGMSQCYRQVDMTTCRRKELTPNTIAAHRRCYSHFLCEATRFVRERRASSTSWEMLSGAAALKRIVKLEGSPYGVRSEVQRMVPLQAHVIAEPADACCTEALNRLPPLTSLIYLLRKLTY